MPRRKKRPTPSPLGWALWFLFLIVTLMVALWVLRPVVVRPPSPIPPDRGPRVKSFPPKKTILPEKKPESKKPLMAIIIDDMGQNPRLEKKFFDLKLPLTFAFLPYAPYTQKLAKEAHQYGYEVLVHLPLEAQSHRSTPGLIRLSLSERQTKYLVRQAILAVPYAVGVNHHMGSLFTENYEHTRWVLEEVKQEGLFYVDSRTTKKSLVPQIARSLGLPYAVRQVFLDHNLSPQEVCKQLKRALKLAQRQGRVVVIGHPHTQTLHILRRERAWLGQKVRLVPVSILLERP